MCVCVCAHAGWGGEDEGTNTHSSELQSNSPMTGSLGTDTLLCWKYLTILLLCCSQTRLKQTPNTLAGYVTTTQPRVNDAVYLLIQLGKWDTENMNGLDLIIIHEATWMRPRWMERRLSHHSSEECLFRSLITWWSWKFKDVLLEQKIHKSQRTLGHIPDPLPTLPSPGSSRLPHFRVMRPLCSGDGSFDPESAGGAQTRCKDQVELIIM